MAPLSLEPHPVDTRRQALRARFQETREFTERLCAPLAAEDYVVQSMPDCSPTKWHLAHVSWFFETFLLTPNVATYRSPNPDYVYLFNSYYNAVGDKYPRPRRGMVSRPTVAEVYRYRAHVDEHVLDLLECSDDAELGKLAPIVTLGVNHEQQHQELILTDLKHMLSHNPLHPVYVERGPDSRTPTPPLTWTSHPEGVYWIGHAGDSFAFDNEEPRHREFVHAFQLACRPATNADYLEFMRDGGYQQSDLWLSMGWATVQQEGWEAPLYWEQRDGEWWQFTLSGFRPVDPAEPVDAHQLLRGGRVRPLGRWPAANGSGVGGRRGRRAARRQFRREPPLPSCDRSRIRTGPGCPGCTVTCGSGPRARMQPIPGFRTAPGALGEYNGKFMCNQYVLRGGSCATPRSHIRPTYRNFFPPDARWQFSGVRLAKDA